MLTLTATSKLSIGGFLIAIVGSLGTRYRAEPTGCGEPLQGDSFLALGAIPKLWASIPLIAARISR